MSSKKRTVLNNVKIFDIANKGQAIAKFNERVILVDKGVPGDICDILVTKKRRKFWKGKIVKRIKDSEHRIEAKCKHFGICGGCKWQNMKYDSQLNFKQNEVLNNLKRIGGVEFENISKIIACDETFLYRNKMEFTFSNKRWLTDEEIKNCKIIQNRNACGFHISGRYDKVIDIEECHLQKEPSNSIRNSIKEFCLKNEISFFDLREKNGLIRNLLIRTGYHNELMVLVQFFKNDLKKINLLMNHLKNSFKSITSLLYVINNKANSTIYDQDVICFSGKKFIEEKIGALSFDIGPKSFFQTNSKQTKILFDKISEIADLKNNHIVYDLYTGTGTIAQYLSKNAKKIIGIDSVEEAINAAKRSSKKNKIKNCTFICGDMKVILNDDFIKSNCKPDVIITDPPREGMHKKVISQIMNVKPEKIVYISCNSATQSRDIAILKELYDIEFIQPVDMFPMTHHVENIVSLTLKKKTV